MTQANNTRGHAPQSRLELSGGAIGKHLMTMGTIGHQLAMNHHGRVGAAVIHAVGHIKKSKAKDKRKAFERKLVALLKKHHFPNHKTADIHKLINGVKDKMIHAKDIFGKNYKGHAEKLLQGIASGSGIFSSIGKAVKKGYKHVKHARDKAFHKLKDFANGKTKFKPSQLANYAAAAIGAAGTASAFIPGVDLISVPAASAAALGLKSASLALKTSGRGLSIPGGSLYGRGNGSGLKLAGQGLPKRVISYLKKHPAIAKNIAKMSQNNIGAVNMRGKGASSKFAATVGVAGTSAAVGAYAMYQYMMKNPAFAAKLVAKGASAVLKGYLDGSGGERSSQKIQAAHKCKRVNRPGSKMDGMLRCKYPVNIKKKGGCRCTGKGGTTGGAFNPSMISDMMSGQFSTMAGLGAALGLTGVALKKAWDYYKKHKKRGKGGRVGGAHVNVGKREATQFSAVQNSYDGGASLPYGVTRTPTGKIKKDRYSVYYGYFNKTGSGLTKSAFTLKGKKVISKKRQAMGKKNMNFRKS